MARRSAFSPRKKPSQQRSRQTVEALLEAAAQVFAQRGYAKATTNHIAERAGLSVGSLYEYFPNKDALLVALVERHIEESESALVGDALPPPSGLSLEAVVAHGVRLMVELHARTPALHRVLFEEAPRPARIRQRLAAFEARATERVEALLRVHPDVHVADVRLAARLVTGVVEAMTHRWVVHGADIPSDCMVAELTALVCGYLRHRAPAATTRM